MANQEDAAVNTADLPASSGEETGSDPEKLFKDKVIFQDLPLGKKSMNNKELVQLVRRRVELKKDLVGLHSELAKLEQRIAATSQKYLAAAKVDEVYNGVALIIDDIDEESGTGNVIMTTFRAAGDDISRSAVIYPRKIEDETFYDLKYRQVADEKHPQGTETSGGRWLKAGEAAIAAKEWIANGRRLGQ